MLTETAKLLICDFLTRKILTKQKSQTLFGIWDFDSCLRGNDKFAVTFSSASF